MNFLNDNFISEGIVLVFKWFFDFVGDYAVVLIILTILIKLITLPLDLKQRSSTRKMSMISAEVQSIQKRYANNPDQMNKKVNELYKERGVSPMAGCWPMLVSMVLLFAFYGALRVVASEQTISIYLRAMHDGAENVTLPGMLWIRNIFQADNGMTAVLPKANEFLSFVQQNANYITPGAMKTLVDGGLISLSGGTMQIGAEYEAVRAAILTANGCMEGGKELFNNGWFVLPVLSAGMLFLQQKLSEKLGGTPTTTENQPGGKMMMYMFPVFSIMICLSSSAMFALYWVMSSVLAIALTVGTSLYYKHKDKHKEITAENFRK